MRLSSALWTAIRPLGGVEISPSRRSPLAGEGGAVAPHEGGLSWGLRASGAYWGLGIAKAPQRLSAAL